MPIAELQAREQRSLFGKLFSALGTRGQVSEAR
jgi:hypothetical protein